MKNRPYMTTRNRSWHPFPWSKIILSFLMISVFLIFATTGTTGPENGSETVASWIENIGKIITGTAIFSMATILLVWAGRLSPNNY